MDPETAVATYEVFLKTLSPDGIPSRAGMENLVKSIRGPRPLRRQETGV